MPPQRYVAVVSGPAAALESSREEYVTTYYPGVVDASAAIELQIAAGAQLQGIDIRVIKIRTVHVRGHVSVGQQESPQQNAMVTMASSDSLTTNRSGGIDRQGNFDISSIVPGPYTLMVRVNQSGKPGYSTHLPLQVGVSGVEGLSITVPPPLDVAGTVRVEGEEPTGLKNLRVTLSPVEMTPGAGSPGATVSDSGAFHMENVSPDRYYITVSGTIGNRYLKSARAGGVDALDGGLDLTGGPPGPIDLVLRANAGRITGIVNGEKPGQPLSGAAIVLIPRAKERRSRPANYKTAVSGEDGRFALANITPGEYQIYCWEQMPQDGDYMDSEFLKPIESKGQAVTIREGDKLDLQVTAIPAGL